LTRGLKARFGSGARSASAISQRIALTRGLKARLGKSARP